MKLFRRRKPSLAGYDVLGAAAEVVERVTPAGPYYLIYLPITAANTTDSNDLWFGGLS